MTIPTTQQQLSAVIGLSEAMLLAAEQQNWEDLNQQETRRRMLLNTVFAATPDLQQAEHIARCIARVLEIDKRIIHLSELGRQALSDKLRDLSQGRRATAAYQNV